MKKRRERGFGKRNLEVRGDKLVSKKFLRMGGWHITEYAFVSRYINGEEVVCLKKTGRTWVEK